MATDQLGEANPQRQVFQQFFGDLLTLIKDTTKQTLPAGFQTAEFLLKRGLIDQVVSRLEMRERLAALLRALHVKKQ